MRLSNKPRHRLVRAGQLAEDRAELALQSAQARTVEAASALDQARGVQQALLQSRSASSERTVDVDRYALGLVLEEAAAVVEQRRQQVLDARSEEQNQAAEVFVSAHQRRRASALRADREARSQADQQAHREFDAVLDVWTGRRKR